jgi:hypothetical protein
MFNTDWPKIKFHDRPVYDGKISGKAVVYVVGIVPRCLSVQGAVI